MKRSPLRVGLLLILLQLAWFGLLPAQVSPPPDGGYPNDNTAEGTGVLGSLSTGSANTANGSSALQNITSGNSNTATGAFALQLNSVGSGNTATS